MYTTHKSDASGGWKRIVGSPGTGVTGTLKPLGYKLRSSENAASTLNHGTVFLPHDVIF